MVLLITLDEGSSVFKSLLAKLSLDSVTSLSNKNVYITTSVSLQKPLFENRRKQDLCSVTTQSIRMKIITFL